MCQTLKKVCNQKVLFWTILFRENDMFCVLDAFFEKHDFELENLLSVRFRNKKSVRFFELKYLKCLRLKIKF